MIHDTGRFKPDICLIERPVSVSALLLLLLLLLSLGVSGCLLKLEHTTGGGS
jgi:hypothetical protein